MAEESENCSLVPAKTRYLRRILATGSFFGKMVPSGIAFIMNRNPSSSAGTKGNAENIAHEN
jgi:hypothetical protein